MPTYSQRRLLLYTCYPCIWWTLTLPLLPQAVSQHLMACRLFLLGKEIDAGSPVFLWCNRFYLQRMYAKFCFSGYTRTQTGDSSFACSSKLLSANTLLKSFLSLSFFSGFMPQVFLLLSLFFPCCLLRVLKQCFLMLLSHTHTSCKQYPAWCFLHSDPKENPPST